MIRTGINQKNKEYWTKLFVDVHCLSESHAELKADLICHEQEIKKLKARIIKLEKKRK